MNWVAKAALMAACSAAPGGQAAYRFLQRRFGNLDGGAMRRVPYAIALWDLLGRHGIEPSGAVFLEVGTGHKPVVPLMLYLLGAGPVHTVDRHRRLDRSLTAAAMRDMYARRDEIRAMAGDRVSPEVFHARMNRLAAATGHADRGLDELGIVYTAPGDAARVDLPDGSVRCHFSVTTLEHVDEPGLERIMGEARRLIGAAGAAVHIIDPSDHFSHADPRLTAAHHFRFSDRMWNLIAGNQFAYCNRLGPAGYEAVFRRAGLRVVHSEWSVDQRAIAALGNGLRIDPQFRARPPDDLAAVNLRVVLKVA